MPLPWDSAAIQFQLHHTGIKTGYRAAQQAAGAEFQLHHTGIKTGGKEPPRLAGCDFNCTIQELKL